MHIFAEFHNLLQIEEIFKFIHSSFEGKGTFHSFFGSFSFFNPTWRGLAFWGAKNPSYVHFVFDSILGICKQKSIHYQATSVSYQKWSINSVGKTVEFEKKQQATSFRHFTFYWSVHSSLWVNDILLFFYGLRRSKNSRKRCEISAVDLEKPQIE